MTNRERLCAGLRRAMVTVLVGASMAGAAWGQPQFERLSLNPPQRTGGEGAKPANFAAVRDEMMRATWGARADGPDAWPAVVDLINLHSPIADELQQPEKPGGMRSALDFALIYDTPGGEGGEAAATARTRAIEAIGRCEKAGVFAAQAALRDRFNIRWPDGSGAMQDWNFTITGNLRPLARMNAARMQLAADAKDWPAIVGAYADQLVVVRITTSNPLLINQLVGYAVTALANKELREQLIASPPDAATMRRLLAIIDDQRPIPAATYTMRAERAYAVDTTEATHGWWGRNSEIRKYEQLFDGMEKLAAVPRWERTAQVFDLDGFAKAKLKTGAGVVNQGDAMMNCLDMYDQAIGDVNATRLLLAILTWQAEKGEPPARLSDLVPGVLAQVPGDPFWQDGFLYKKLETPDAAGRRFVLYSVATDGVDNGGVMSDNPRKWPFNKGGAGTDMVYSSGR